jgi:hypothetical protein
MFSKAPSTLAKHTKWMTLVENNTEPIFILQFDYLVQWGNLTRILQSPQEGVSSKDLYLEYFMDLQSASLFNVENLHK